jgi:polysaccharide deacetylase 2 family uncharacterized protein YibQ
LSLENNQDTKWQLKQYSVAVPLNVAVAGNCPLTKMIQWKKGGRIVVIQSNMSPNNIVEVWEGTITVFNKYNVSISAEQSLVSLVKEDVLPTLLKELNESVGSSSVTCVEGG